MIGEEDYKYENKKKVPVTISPEGNFKIDWMGAWWACQDSTVCPFLHLLTVLHDLQKLIIFWQTVHIINLETLVK